MSKKPAHTIHLNFETVASIVAMVVGVCALYVTWDQSQVMRKQQHAAVWPLVRSEFNFDSTADLIEVSLVMHNDGVGPALVEHTMLNIDGQQIRSWPQFMGYFPDVLAREVKASIGTTTGVLGAGASQTVFRLEWPRTEETVAGMQEFTQRIVGDAASENDFQACYCSVFERCWKMAGADQVKPERVKSCPSPGQDFSDDMIKTMNQMASGNDEE